MPQHLTASTVWPLGDMEPVISDLRNNISILSHLITANSAPSNEVEDGLFHKVQDDLRLCGGRIEELWKAAWDANKAETAALKAEHTAAVASVRAEKAAPGSEEAIRRAAGLWSLIRCVAEMTAEYCIEAGYPPRPPVAPATEPAGEATPC